MKQLKGVLPILLLSIITCACKTAELQKEPTATIISTADSILNQWHLDAAEANYESYFAALDSSSIFIGTDALENWDKKAFQAFAKPHFDKGQAWDFKTLERNIYVGQNATTAWFDELLDTWMGTCRGSGVLEKSKGQWKLKHYVLSLTIPNDDIKAVKAITHYNDSIVQDKFK